MRITQGAFSFLPDLTDEQIAKQVQYCIDNGWAVSLEFTDDPHPRNTYWDMWGHPDVRQPGRGRPHDGAEGMPQGLWRQTTFALSPSTTPMAGNRSSCPSSSTGPPEEPGFHLARQEGEGRVVRYTTRSYATDKPAGQRYG